jgi:hypothetical protein
VHDRVRGRSLTRITFAAIGVVLLVLAALLVSFTVTLRSFEQEAELGARADRTLQTANTLERTVIGDLDAAFAPTEAAIRRAVAA